MAVRPQIPSAEGQLVWCPADPQLGIGVITGVEGRQVRVRFMRLQEERAYTTRGDIVLLRYKLRTGERVRDLDGTEHRIRRVVNEGNEGLASYELEDGREVIESDLEPNVRDIGAKERLASLNLVHPEVVRARLSGLRLAAIGARPGYAAILGSRALWLPHQIDVSTRAIERSPVRMLLADEVGLGKTVEAALIYAGLRYEGRAERILILTPTALCIQWLGELYRKTHELLVLMDEQRLEDSLVDFPDLSPFEAHQRIVASIDTVSSDDELRTMALEATWDLVIVDEAHHLKWRPGGESNPAYELVQGLSHRTRHLLLLTATPMALDPAEYHALLRLLDPGRFDDPKAFESISERVANIRDVARGIATAVADKKALPKKLQTTGNKILNDDPDDKKRLDGFAKLAPAAKNRADAADEVLAALRDRHGLAEYVVRNRRGPVGGLPQRRPQVFPLEPTEQQETLIDVGESVMFELANTIDEPHERYRTLGTLLRALWAAPRALSDILGPLSPQLALDLAPYIGKVVGAPLDREGLPTGDARLRWLVRLVRRLEDRGKVLVFVESAIAVKALKDSLDNVLGPDIAMFHRGLPPRDQDRQVAWFRDPNGPQVMLSTEAGGEGRNFQFCHRVVLYDMPWRPATVEQRIGRVDRVGQRNDVHVLVPYFKSGYEAAVLKVMQESIGVLDRTVGGIDHALEYVSDRLAALVLEGGSVDDWKALYLETSELIEQTRERIERGVDPILDHASFSPARAQAVLDSVPADLEARAEELIERFAEHSKIDVHSKGGSLVAVEGAPGAAGRTDSDGYVATFSRTHALDHEDVEFLSFGHPLVEQALEWSREADDASAALAIARGYDADGAVFLWRYGMDLPEDVPAAATYFDKQDFTFALDEAGSRVAAFEDLLDDPEQILDRMDPGPLKDALGRWRQLVEANYDSADDMATARARTAVDEALGRLEVAMSKREKDLVRLQTRELARLPKSGKARKEAMARHTEAQERLAAERHRIEAAIMHARPRLLAAVAVRLMKSKQVSA